MSAITLCELVSIGLNPVVTWMKRQQLTLKQDHQRKVADTLTIQIANDTRALAYVQRQQAITASMLNEVSK